MARADGMRMSTSPTLTRDQRTFAIIGAAMAVHRVLGCGHLEAIYRDALAIEFDLSGFPSIAKCRAR